MTDGEKNAIEMLNYWLDYNIKHITPVKPALLACVGKALNLIEKQQKEIELLKANKEMASCVIENYEQRLEDDYYGRRR